MAARASDGAVTTYRERLWVSPYAWLLCPLAMLGASAVAVVLLAPRGVLAVALVTAALVAIGLWRWSALVTVTGGPRPTLHAGRARIELTHLGPPRVRERADAQRLRMADYDPRAFHLMRSWIPAAVTVTVDDPDDPTTYWYVSTRHPEALAKALRPRAAARSDVSP